jgi:hypothetical protein
VSELLERIIAKRKHSGPCKATMVERARRILAGLGAAFLLACTPAQIGQVARGASVVLDAVCEARDSGMLDLARDWLEQGDIPAAIAALRSDFIESHDPDVGALITLLEGELRRNPVADAP